MFGDIISPVNVASGEPVRVDVLLRQVDPR